MAGAGGENFGEWAKRHLVWSGPFLARTIDEDWGTEELIC